jgi:ornithine cyclodeaminase/alanine dehydrogenase-like protein (mu-crystallin family)
VGRGRPAPHAVVTALELTYLNGPDVERLALTDDEILDAVEAALRAQGEGATVLEPRMHLKPDPAVDGHFNVLRGAVRPLGLAGVKVVGDFHGNYRHGLPSEMGLLALFDPGTGQPLAVVDAAGITDMRTGAVTALGARHLAPRAARVLGHIGARGTAYWNVRLLARVLGDLEEIRVHSRRPESRDAFAARLEADLGRPVTVTDDWESCVRGTDVVVEASRLEAPEPLLLTEWIKPGALVVPYGTMSAVELSLTSIMDKVIVDDWGQAGAGPFGALRRHVDEGLVTAESLHAELGQIVAGLRPGRESEDETILFWHRGLSTTDVALGHALLAKAERLGVGQTLRYR